MTNTMRKSLLLTLLILTIHLRAPCSSAQSEATSEDGNDVECVPFKVKFEEVDVVRGRLLDEFVAGGQREVMIVKADENHKVRIILEECEHADRPEVGTPPEEASESNGEVEGNESDDSVPSETEQPITAVVKIAAKIPGRDNEVTIPTEASYSVPSTITIDLAKHGSSAGTRYSIVVTHNGTVIHTTSVRVEQLGFNASYKDVTSFVESSFGTDFSTGFVGTVGYRADRTQGWVQDAWNLFGIRVGVGLNTLTFRRHFEAEPDDNFPAELGVSAVLSFHDLVTVGFGRNLTADNITRRNYVLVGTSLAKIIGFIQPEPAPAPK